MAVPGTTREDQDILYSALKTETCAPKFKESTRSMSDQLSVYNLETRIEVLNGGRVNGVPDLTISQACKKNNQGLKVTTITIACSPMSYTAPVIRTVVALDLTGSDTEVYASSEGTPNEEIKIESTPNNITHTNPRLPTYINRPESPISPNMPDLLDIEPLPPRSPGEIARSMVTLFFVLFMHYSYIHTTQQMPVQRALRMYGLFPTQSPPEVNTLMPPAFTPTIAEAVKRRREE